MNTFTPKQVTLVANVAQSMVWNNFDFRPALATDIIETNVSPSFEIKNDTANVLYIGISYATKTRTYALGERKSVAAVPANTTMIISSKTVSSLVRFEVDVISITIELISASSGNVTVTLGIQPYDGSVGSGGFSPIIGYDKTSERDETYFNLQFQSFIASGDSFLETHTVTAGKQCIVSSIAFTLPKTSYAWSDIYVQLRAPNGQTLTLVSSPFESAILSMNETSILYGKSAETFELEILGQNPGSGIDHGYVSLLVVLKEFF